MFVIFNFITNNEQKNLVQYLFVVTICKCASVELPAVSYSQQRTLPSVTAGTSAFSSSPDSSFNIANTKDWPPFISDRKSASGSERYGTGRSLYIGTTFPVDHSFSDTRHVGDLFGVRRNIHSLTWAVDLSNKCHINDVIKKIHLNFIRFFRKNVFYINAKKENIFLKDKLEKCKNILNLLLIKKILPFGNTYLIAHPYFRFYHKLASHMRRKFKRFILGKHLRWKSNTTDFQKFTLCEIINATVNSLQDDSSNKNSSLKTSSTDDIHQYLKSHSTQSKAHTFEVHHLPCNKLQLFICVELWVNTYLQLHPCVLWHSQEVLNKRTSRRNVRKDWSHFVHYSEHLSKKVKRGAPHFIDPLYKDQWHLHGCGNCSNDTLTYNIGVSGAWESGVTGEGITVCVIDDGLEWNHTDIRDNYNSFASYDLNADDPDPSPARNGEANEHGTRCAGEIAGVANTVCGVGVAWRAKVAGVRVLGGRMTDSMEAQAFSYLTQHNHVYSCSWGPEDDGRTVDGPHALGRRALVWGTSYGRGGRGSVYVVASGNGGDVGDNCNFDGYANSIHTLTIGAMDSSGHLPYYAERCAAMLAVAPSSGGGRDIVTTDWHVSSPSGCTLHHTGTSAAAPLAAGVVALALQTQPCLGWRDVQHLIVVTSRQIDPDNPEWHTNAAGLHHSHIHGFGLLDASAVVSAAAVWESLPFSSKFLSPRLTPPDGGALGTEGVTVEYAVEEEQLERFGLRTLESVEVRVWLQHEYRGSVGFELACPSGTPTTLATPRLRDNSSSGLQGWPLVTVRCWGEDPAGTYRLTVRQAPQLTGRQLTGRLQHWQLVLHGSSAPLQEMRQRIRRARAAARGEGVHISNRSQLCYRTPPHYPHVAPVPPTWLKLLLLLGCMAAVAAVMFNLEYAFCYGEEKKRFRDALLQVQLARRTFRRRGRQCESAVAGSAGTRHGRNGALHEDDTALEVAAATRGTPREEEATSSCDELTTPLLHTSPCRPSHSRLLLPRPPSSPSLSCDADQSASPDDNTDDDDDGAEDGTSTTQPRDTTDHAFTTTDHNVSSSDQTSSSSEGDHMDGGDKHTESAGTARQTSGYGGDVNEGGVAGGGLSEGGGDELDKVRKVDFISLGIIT